MISGELVLKKREQRRIRSGHPWVFSNEVDTRKSPLKQFSPGQQVKVVASDGKLLGTGYVNPRSLICTRIFSGKQEPLDYKLLKKRIENALDLRETLFSVPYYRMVYGESDLLPGLVIDRFGDHFAVQLNTAGMDLLQEEVLAILKNLFRPSSILFCNNSASRKQEGLAQMTITGHGSPPVEIKVQENGVQMTTPFLEGQKTGWFYDQRVNRAQFSSLIKGRRVLDVFSYVGSFAIQAGVAGAAEIWVLDSSRTAIEMAEKNAVQNGIEQKFTGAIGDAFDVLKTLREEGEQFDAIVVDPPAFIKRKKDHPEGFRAYRRVNELALRLLSDKGILLSATCSMHLHRDELLETLRGAATGTGRHLQIIYEGGQGPDHPIHPAIPETRYLKAFIARANKLYD